ncbi:MAG: hypothetical protein AAFP70_17735, partial [Calditrichota bacterium]
TRALTISGEYSKVRTKQPFDLIGGEDALDITWQNILFGIGYRAINRSSWELGFKISAGLLLFGNEAYSVNLGAAGQLDIKAKTESKFLAMPGLNIIKRLNNRVSFFLEPGISITSLSGTKINTHLKGGIGFAIH